MNLKEKNVLILQGGGALGAYQAGAYSALHEAGYEMDWLSGISIGAINSALIAGNPPEKRIEKLKTFWTKVSAGNSVSLYCPDILAAYYSMNPAQPKYWPLEPMVFSNHAYRRFFITRWDFRML